MYLIHIVIVRKVPKRYYFNDKLTTISALSACEFIKRYNIRTSDNNSSCALSHYYDHRVRVLLHNDNDDDDDDDGDHGQSEGFVVNTIRGFRLRHTRRTTFCTVLLCYCCARLNNGPMSCFT